MSRGDAQPDSLAAPFTIPATDHERALALLFHMELARHLDRVEMELVNRGEAFFHVGGGGHEASAALASHLGPDDWLHLHYRDKALMLARGVTPAEFLHSLLCTASSHSAGRQMSAHLSAPALHVMSLVGPVGNNALQAVGVAHELVSRRAGGVQPNPIVVCAMGDGTTQQGEVLEAIGEAVRSRLPMLFVVEDNGLAISTTTRGRTFYDLPAGPTNEFHGMPVVRLDGRDAWACHHGFAEDVARVRAGSGPVAIVLTVERLTHHTNGDDERVYRPEAELRAIRASGDPIRVLRERLHESGVSEPALDAVAEQAARIVRAEVGPALETPNPATMRDARAPWTGPRTVAAEDVPRAPDGGSRTMLEALREVLRQALADDPRVSLYGEDIEDPKGDVFGLTRGLGGAFPGRVTNSPLSESTIVGVSIGRALAGGRPIAFIQFADFLPLAFNQIVSELASLWWRSNGAWNVPVVILAPCGGYRPGLGPFHAQTFEATFAHVPGLDVVMPACAEDAAGLLRGVLAGGRPTLFLYPKMMLNDAALATPLDPLALLVAPGEARTCRRGDDVTLVSWGATVPMCLAAADALATAGVESTVIDLRSQSPWDRDAVLRSARRTGRLVVVHEDNHSGGFGAEVVATVAEEAGVPVAVRRIARPDTHVPCNYVNQLDVLPSVRRILEVVAPLTGVELELAARQRAGAAATDATEPGQFVVEAVGSSPADQNVVVVEWLVREGASVVAGETIAECEADKATFELCAPVSGVVVSLRETGESVKVGAELARIRVAPDAATFVRRVPVEPALAVRRSTLPPALAHAAASQAVTGATRDSNVVGLAGLSFVTGGVPVDNAELVARFPGRSPADIVQRTGIESRFRCGPGETVLTLATAAARKALAETGLTLRDLDAILVSTSTPLAVTPSLACQLQHELAQDGEAKDVQATDLFAACSGFLYALQIAHDHCRANPHANVLLVTSEAMSGFVDADDFDTAIVFGDAATAVVVRGAAHLTACPVRAARPVLAARGEDGSVLSLAKMERAAGSVVTPVSMNGVKVFSLAVREMSAMLGRACASAGIAVAELDWIVPHQANERIIRAAQQRAKVPAERVFSNVARYGNTSSSSIPMALAEMVAEGKRGRVGLTAFGGGFTFGAGLIEL